MYRSSNNQKEIAREIVHIIYKYNTSVIIYACISAINDTMALSCAIHVEFAPKCGFSSIKVKNCSCSILNHEFKSPFTIDYNAVWGPN